MSTVRTDKAHAAPRVSSEILDRLPPQNLDAEKAVLGSLLLDGDLCDEVALVLRSTDFYADANQKLYEHILAMHEAGKRIDALLLLNRLDEAGDLEAIGGKAYLGEVAQSVPWAANAVHYATIVRDKATLRALIHASTEILRDAYDTTVDPATIVNDSEKKIFDVRDQRSSDHIIPIQDLIVEAFDRIDARLEHGEGRGRTLGVPRLGQFDRRLARVGIHRAGRPAEHGQDGAGDEYRRERGHQQQQAGAVREFGNGPARAGPAHAVFAGTYRRQQIPQRFSFGRRSREFGESLGEIEPGASVRR